MQYKFLFSGPVGSGKTTAIRTISDIETVNTDVAASDMTTRRKETTTVTMDYGMIRLPGGGKIHLYGTPGQERFDFMWEILSTGCLGLAILIDNLRSDPFQNLGLFLERFRSLLGDDCPIVVCVTKMDIASVPDLSEYRKWMAANGLRHPVFSLDARRRREIQVVLQSMIYISYPFLESDG